MADKVIDIPGVGPVAFPDTMTPDEIDAAAAKVYREAQAQPVGTSQRGVIGRATDAARALPPLPTADAAPEGSVFQRMLGNFAQAVLPSTTPSDYWEGPLYALRHPSDALSLLGGAIVGAHTDQAGKTADSARRVLAEPTLGGKALSAVETIGHGLATAIPFVGPAAAQAGEQIASGDIAGGVGRGLGLLAPTVTPAAVRAAAPVRNAAAQRLSASATGQMERALAATTNENKARAARIAPEMTRRRIWGRDLQSVEARAALESDKAGQAVGDAVRAVANKEVDVLPLVERLEDAKAQFIGQATDGRRVVNDAAPVQAMQQVQDVLMEYGDRITIGSLNKLRQNLDATVQAGKGFTVADLGTKWKTWAAREGRTALREELSKASPDIDTVMAEFAFWQNLEDVAHATNQRRVGQSGTLTPTIAAGAGAIVGEAVAPGAGIAGKLGGAVIGGQLAASLRRLLSSPGYQMWSAVQKQRLADALASGNQSVITDAVSKGLTAVAALERPSSVFSRMAGGTTAQSGPAPEPTY